MIRVCIMAFPMCGNILSRAIPLFLLYPWASISLWNERWNMMSFGPYRLNPMPQWTKLMKRYLLFYLAPFLLFMVGIYAGFSRRRAAVPWVQAGWRRWAAWSC